MKTVKKAVEEKFQIFLEVTSELNKKLGIIPVLYGSLGLSRLLNDVNEVSDIDVLVPDEFVTGKWEDLKSILEELGFELLDMEEHEFVREGQKVAFAEQSDLGDVNLSIADLQKSEENGVPFYELNLEQYLAVYKYCLHDGYRQTKHSDKQKIALIEQALRK